MAGRALPACAAPFRATGWGPRCRTANDRGRLSGMRGSSVRPPDDRQFRVPQLQDAGTVVCIQDARLGDRLVVHDGHRWPASQEIGEAEASTEAAGARQRRPPRQHDR